MATFTVPETEKTPVATNGSKPIVISAAQSPPAAQATEKSEHAKGQYISVAYVLVVGGALLGWGLDVWLHPTAPVAVQGLGIFAALYVAAQAIERVIEPITEWTGTVLGGNEAPSKDAVEGNVGPDDSKATERVWSKAELRYRRALAIQTARSAAAGQQVGGASGKQPSKEETATVAAKAQAAVEQDRRNTTVLVWGIASFLGIVLSGWLGLALLRSVGVPSTPRVLDIIVTGLAIGGGSKPLHDLISNLQASKDEKKDPAEVKTA
jgi:hypothetical protein